MNIKDHQTGMHVQAITENNVVLYRCRSALSNETSQRSHKQPLRRAHTQNGLYMYLYKLFIHMLLVSDNPIYIY